MSQKVQYYFDILRTRTRNGAEEKERENGWFLKTGLKYGGMDEW